MGSETKTKQAVKRSLAFVALGLVVLLILLPVGGEIAYQAGLLPESPSQALLRAFGADASDDDSEFVEFLAVGQGDTAIIKSRDMAAVIDFGPPDETDRLYHRLIELGIDRLDLAVVTHHQQDHMGGLADLYEQFEIDRLLISPTTAEDGDDAFYQQILKYANAAGTVIYTPVVGGKHQIGNALLEVLFADQTAKTENNRSLVLRLTIGGKRMIFTGDLERQGEKKLLQSSVDLTADVFQLGHHGSNTSNHEAFLKAVQPKLAIASSGYDHVYGHPSDAVVKRLEQLDIALYRTDLDGDIRLTPTASGITVQTEWEGLP